MSHALDHSHLELTLTLPLFWILARGTQNEFAASTFLVPVPPCCGPSRCTSQLSKLCRALAEMDKLRQIALEAYDKFIGLRLTDVAVDCCITKAPCGGEVAGRNPVDRGKQGIKRSTVVDAKGIPLGAVVSPANRHDCPLLDETLDDLELLGKLPEQMTVYLDRGYDSRSTKEKLEDSGLLAMISEKGKPAPLQATKRWVVERTRSWHNAYKKLAWCTERREQVIDFWVAFSEVINNVRRLIREG